MLSRQEKAKTFRERFFGRQEVFGRRWESRRGDGTVFSGYAPVCQNLWSDRCGLKTKTSGCDGCAAKQYEPVSDESVLRHIEGHESQIQYVLQPDGTIFFGALDFDKKQAPGKEHLDYGWEDVAAVDKLLTEWGVPHALATSTGHGWHCYFFFDGPYSAAKFRAVMVEVFERVGFMEKMRQGIRPLCEVFPKQSYVSSDSIGNGIKTPCIEPNWVNGKNGFIDSNGAFIPPEHQWDYLRSVPRIPGAMFDELIAKYEIPVYEDCPTTPTTAGGAPTNGERRRTGKWQPPLSGSIEKVLSACPAFKKIRAKVENGEVLGHAEGFALYRMAMSTADGVDWFKNNVKGWGTNPSELKQLEHSLKKNYAPDSCKKLQEQGVCVPGTKCLHKKPPLDVCEGQTVVRTDLPESQWPEPSPIRYAFSAGDDFLEKLKTDTLKLQDEKDHDKLLKELDDLFFRVQVFDEDQQKDYKAFVKALKLIKPGEFSKLFNKAADAAQKETEKNAGERSDMILTHGNWYKKLHPFGYAVAKPSRQKTKETPICMADIRVEEERAYIDDGRVVQTVFKGTCAGAGVEKTFEISHEKWIENADFAKHFLATLGNVFNIQRPNVDAIRQAAMAFSQRDGISKSSHLVTQGWYGNSYLMPTVLVDKDGVRPNTEQQVTLTGKEHAKHMDFVMLSDSVFKEVMLHIKKDLLNAWPRYWMAFGLSHTFLPCFMRPLGLNQKRPTLFYEGLTGSGKTEITHILQQFWGQFPAPLNLIGSAKGIMEEAYQFKDAILVVDDYKGIDKYQIDTLKKVIQYSYDGTTAAKLNRDSSQQKEKGSRATLMMSGEQFLQSEASAIARTILIEVDKHDTMKTREAYAKSWQMAKLYRGVTPRFIHWILNQDHDKLKKMMERFHSEFQSRSTGKQNSARIALNLALNFLSWNMWVSFMVDSDVADRKEGDELVAEHLENIYKAQDHMLGRCEEEQSALVFLRVLRQLVSAREVSIHNLDGYYNERKPQVGFVAPGSPDIVNLYPDVAINVVRSNCRDIGFAGSDRSIARQLLEMNVICGVDSSRLKKLVRYGQTRQRVWPVRLSELGFDAKSEEASVVPLRAVGEKAPKLDENGIY